MRKLKNSELDRLSIEAFKTAEKTSLIIVLDNVRSLHNIGAIFRTADAFLIEKIYLCGITATPPHRDIHKTALGATDTVSWEYIKDIDGLINDLNKQNVNTVCVEQAEGAIFLNDFDVKKDKKYALIFGNEVKGVSQSVVSNSKHVVEIPQYGTKHSLNIGVSAGLVIWEFFSKLK